MALNKQSGNMYGFVNFTWNTIKGKCFHNCSYCFVKRFPQNEVRFDEKELKTNLGENNFIFIGSSCDMFAVNIDETWIKKTLDHCNKFDNKYLFQSKNPGRFESIVFPKKSILCTTIESNRYYSQIMGNSPFILNRLQGIEDVLYPKMITIEPILDFDLKEFIEIIKQVKPFQVNIGADSGNNNLPEPPKEKILELINELNKLTKVYLKDNLTRLIK